MNKSTSKRIYCIPGQGVDHHLFSRLKIENAELIPIKWAQPQKNETMHTYAQKLSAQVDTTQPFYLMGVSLGGMLCSEMNTFLKPEKTIFISTAISRAELPWRIKTLKYFPIYKLFGNAFFTWIAVRNRWLFGVKKEDAALFKDMQQNLPPDYFSITSDCIVLWKGTGKVPGNFIHIHGTNDKVIPLKQNMNAIKIDGGEHFMLMNQWMEISTIINNAIQR